MEAVMCPGCGKRAATERRPSEYRYIECGLSGITLHGGVVETICSECGEKFVRVQHEGQLLQVIALTLLTGPSHLIGPELRFLRHACELSQAELATALRVRRATVADREAMTQLRSKEAEQTWIRLVLLNEFRKHLAKPERNYLSESHMKRFFSFRHEFSERALEMAKHAIRRHAKDLRMGQDDIWEMPEAA